MTNRDVTGDNVTIKTSGSCSTDGDAWVFLGPIVGLHASLQVATNWLLFKVRIVTDRYQEQKYVALASLFVLEILVVGVPVLVAVKESPAARYIVMAAIVVFNGTCPGRELPCLSNLSATLKRVVSILDRKTSEFCPLCSFRKCGISRKDYPKVWVWVNQSIVRGCSEQ